MCGIYISISVHWLDNTTGLQGLTLAHVTFGHCTQQQQRKQTHDIFYNLSFINNTQQTKYSIIYISSSLP